MNTKPKLIGWQSNESPLTQDWITQSELLWNFLHNQDVRFDYAFCSTALRTRQTIYHVFKEMRFEKDITFHDELLELSQWDREKKPRKDIYTAAQLTIMNKDNYRFRPPGWESQEDITNRYDNFMKKYVLNLNIPWERRKVYIQAHGLWIKFYVGHILWRDKKNLRKYELNNTSITKVHYDEKDGWYLGWFNLHPHV